MTINTVVELIKAIDIENIAVAEVGVFVGETTVAYLPHIRRLNGIVYAIDHWCGEPLRNGVWDQQLYRGKDAMYHDFMTTVKDYQNIVKVLYGYSTLMAEFIPERSLDLCFIDADHRYHAVMADIESFLPKVKIGGTICGHDCERRGQKNEFSAKETYINRNLPGHLGVIQAVYDWFEDDYSTITDSVWIHRVTGQERLC